MTTQRTVAQEIAPKMAELSANVLFGDWRVEGFDRHRMKRESQWLPPKVLWDPDAGKHRAPDPPETKRQRPKRSKNSQGGG